MIMMFMMMMLMPDGYVWMMMLMIWKLDCHNRYLQDVPSHLIGDEIVMMSEIVKSLRE